MIPKNAKYHWISLLSTEMLKIIVEQNIIPFEIAIKYNVLNMPAEAMPRIRGTAKYYLNQRAGKHGNPSPAQRRARILGQTKFFLTSANSQIIQAKNHIQEWAGTDLSHNEIYELEMQLVWLLEEIKIAMVMRQKLSDSKLPQRKLPQKKGL